VYLWAMSKVDAEGCERLIRVRAVQRDRAIELLVHYGKSQVNGCDLYRLYVIEEVDSGSSTA